MKFKLLKKPSFWVYISIQLVLVFMLIASGCQWEVPHNNPLDPANYRYQPFASLVVKVLDVDTDIPISGAEVRISEINSFKNTNILGCASFDNIPTNYDSLLIFVEKRGGDGFNYMKDSAYVRVNHTQIDTLVMYLKTLPPSPGSLTIEILTLRQTPIVNATVLISELGLFRTTNDEGVVTFSSIEAGSWYVTAFRAEDVDSTVVFARDSIRVRINSGSHTSARILLNALPYFSYVNVRSITLQQRTASYLRWLVMSASVEDPDGQAHLTGVYWRISESLNGALRYNPSTTYWEAEIADSLFSPATIYSMINVPIVFEAFDASGNSAQEHSTLMRVINDSPDARPPDVSWSLRPNLRWDYEYRNQFADTSQFEYVVQVLRETHFDPELVYSRTVNHTSPTFREEHIIEEDLPRNDYFWYVYVVDSYGNYSRTYRGRIIVPIDDI